MSHPDSKYYFTGKPCKRGHAGLRRRDSRTCVECHRENSRARKACARKKQGATRVEPTVCELCGKPPSIRSLCFDHCHITGKFRGWLCVPCNLGIGQLGDNVRGLMRAINYLERVPKTLD